MATMPMTVDRTDTPVIDPRLVLVAIFVVALIPLATTPVLPFIDFYDHLARYFVLAHLDDSPSLARNYRANWSLLPNIGLDVIGVGLLKIMSPRFAAHVIVAGMMAVQYGGVLTFNRVLTGRWSLLVALLLVPLLYSFILNWGFANFLLGLGLAFFGAAWWLKQRDHLAVGLPVALVVAVVIFLTHGLAFALYGLLIASLEVGYWREGRDRRLSRLAASLVPVVAQAVVPVILFVTGRVVQAFAGVTNAGDAVTRLAANGGLAMRLWQLLDHRILTILRVAEGPSLAFDVVTFVFKLALLGFLFRRRQVILPAIVWPAMIVATVLVVVMPPALFGVGYVADRMPLFFALLLVGSLSVQGNGALARIALIPVGALAAIRLVAIIVNWQVYTQLDDELARVAARIPPGSLVDEFVVGGMPRDASGTRYQMYGSLLIANYGQVGPLFANATEQPITLVGPLRTAVDARSRSTAKLPTAAYDERLAAMSLAGFDYVLVCHAEWLTRPLPAARIVVRTPHFLLLDVRARSS